MKSIIQSKKAALELSMTTVVVIVLAMVMLILGLTLVGKIFSGATGNVDEINDKVKDLINEMLVSSNEELVFYLAGNTAEISQGTIWGVAFGFSPEVAGAYSYSTTVSEVSETACPGITENEAENLIILGKAGDLGEISSGGDSYGLIKIQIPQTYPLGCQIRYKVAIDGEDYSKTKSFDVAIVRKKVAGIF